MPDHERMAKRRETLVDIVLRDESLDAVPTGAGRLVEAALKAAHAAVRAGEHDERSLA